ncbi:MAG: hypothetical protein V3S20_10515 [Dehalococcoidia bacterium]
MKQSVSVAELTVEPAGIDETSKATSERLTLFEVDLIPMVVAVPKVLVAWN